MARMGLMSGCFQLELSPSGLLAPRGDDSGDRHLLRLRPIERVRATSRDDSPCPYKPGASCTSLLSSRQQREWIDPPGTTATASSRYHGAGRPSESGTSAATETGERSRIRSITSCRSVVFRRRLGLCRRASQLEPHDKSHSWYEICRLDSKRPVQQGRATAAPGTKFSEQIGRGGIDRIHCPSCRR